MQLKSSSKLNQKEKELKKQPSSQNVSPDRELRRAPSNTNLGLSERKEKEKPVNAFMGFCQSISYLSYMLKKGEKYDEKKAAVKVDPKTRLMADCLSSWIDTFQNAEEIIGREKLTRR